MVKSARAYTLSVVSSDIGDFLAISSLVAAQLIYLNYDRLSDILVFTYQTNWLTKAFWEVRVSKYSEWNFVININSTGVICYAVWLSDDALLDWAILIILIDEVAISIEF
jgi:hypothetical protein